MDGIYKSCKVVLLAKCHKYRKLIFLNKKGGKMKVLRNNRQALCIFMAVLMLIVSIPRESVLAALVDTGTVMDSVQSQKARDQVRQFLAREDVQAVLIAHGIDPIEAQSRINALSDDEVMRLSEQIDQLPAGGGAAEFLLVVLLVVVLVFVILDLTGVTDVFTFIKPQK
jgi:hypothetical protein